MLFNFWCCLASLSLTYYRSATWSPVWERAVHSVNYACLLWALVKLCVCLSFPFGIEGGMWDVIVLIPDHCLSIYFGISSYKFPFYYNEIFTTYRVTLS